MQVDESTLRKAGPSGKLRDAVGSAKTSLVIPHALFMVSAGNIHSGGYKNLASSTELCVVIAVTGQVPQGFIGKHASVKLHQLQGEH